MKRGDCPRGAAGRRLSMLGRIDNSRFTGMNTLKRNRNAL